MPKKKKEEERKVKKVFFTCECVDGTKANCILGIEGRLSDNKLEDIYERLAEDINKKIGSKLKKEEVIILFYKELGE